MDEYKTKATLKNLNEFGMFDTVTIQYRIANGNPIYQLLINGVKFCDQIPNFDNAVRLAVEFC